MLRQATVHDVPMLARHWYAEKTKTCFNQLHIAWTIEGCAGFLMEALSQPQYHVCVSDVDGHITAACGVVLQQDLLPPHPLVAGEWMWWGSDKRAVVQVLHAANQWGKDHGAVLARYTLNRPSSSPTKFTETYRWEVL